MSITMTKKISECHSETVQFMSIEKVEEDECITSRDPHTNVAVLRRGKKLQENNNLTKEDVEYLNYRQLLKYEQAPVYLQHNPYIRHGYRKLLPTKLCWESIFWWTNETMNIWTHIFGFFLLLFLTINDLLIINVHATVTDKIVAGILFSCFLKAKKVLSKDQVALLVDLIQNNPILTSRETNAATNRCKEDTWITLASTFNARSGSVPRTKEQLKLKWDNLKKAARKRSQQIRMNSLKICMAMSSLYHTFSCRSECDYNTFLMYDLFGIALSLLAIYTSGIYYAFWCNSDLKNFYMTSVTLIFIIAMVLQIPRLNVPYIVKMCVFIGWAAYGVVPTLHWTYSLGGFENPMVQIFFPRVIGMYLISGSAFIIYAFKVPERWFPGKVDYIGHSHQWWHVLVLGALYYWHNSAMIYVQYRMNHGCSNTMRIF